MKFRINLGDREDVSYDVYDAVADRKAMGSEFTPVELSPPGSGPLFEFVAKWVRTDPYPLQMGKEDAVTLEFDTTAGTCRVVPVIELRASGGGDAMEIKRDE